MRFELIEVKNLQEASNLKTWLSVKPRYINILKPSTSFVIFRKKCKV